MTDKDRILIVDDSPSNIKILNKILHSQYEITAATSGQSALDIVLRPKTPDLILLDIMMPEMDGYEVCRRLKADTKTRDIPVVFVTGMGDVEDEAKGLELGAVDYITKPISPPIVKARVKNQLLLKSQHDQLKESISVMEHEAEILQQKAEIGIQAGGLAHDINNILAACMIVDMLQDILPKDYPQKAIVENYIDVVLGSIRLCREVCQGFTSYLKDIGAEASLQPVSLLLQPLDMYSKIFRGEFIREFADDLPQIKCKGYQIKRVLVNLFTNASQAIESQDEQIITVRAWHEDGQLFFSVRDNGPGIPSDILHNIFKEGFTTKDKSTGLGLFMVKEIIDNHNGTIEVDTKKGKGTVFRLSLPTTQDETKVKLKKF